MIEEVVCDILRGPLYEKPSIERRAHLLDLMQKVIRHHMDCCPPYRRFCEKGGVVPEKLCSLEDIPFLPTSIFKSKLLLSIPENEVFRELRSSATSSGHPSRIGLSRSNNRNWILSLQRILAERLGNRKFQTMVFDDKSSLVRSEVVTARASMTRSVLFLAKEVSSCLIEKNGVLRLQREKLEVFLENCGKGECVMLFGFTFILYSYVVKLLLERGKTFKLPEALIMHAGGWKKLEATKVTEQQFIEDCCRCFGTRPENVIDLYGFSEQGGIMYPTCEYGFRHTPAWAEVICRDPLTLESLESGKEGLLQFISPMQTSYPGHSVLTEDIGYIVGRDDCACGRKGTIFRVVGRSDKATEERGCGDIMADVFAKTKLC